MTRIALLTLCVVAPGLAAVGCSRGDNGPRNDMPIKTSSGVDKKTGKQQKIMEATFEDPNAGKK